MRCLDVSDFNEPYTTVSLARAAMAASSSIVGHVDGPFKGLGVRGSIAAVTEICPFSVSRVSPRREHLR